MALKKKHWIGIGLAAAVGTILAVGHARFEGPINALAVDLAHPDAFIATSSLSRLPRDFVNAPVVRDVLTEDFAFYYEEHEDRLGLRGALKRIAFEHEVTWTDRLLESALDEPAEMAFWVDPKGAPRHWLLAMTRSTLAQALQHAASIAAKDNQFSLIGKVTLAGTPVSVHALKLSARRTLALAALGNRVVVLSDPGILFDAQRQSDPQAVRILSKLLSAELTDQAVLRRNFGLPEPGERHTLVADARLLSFGYRDFFPSLQAMRLDLAPGGKDLDLQVRMQGTGASPAAAPIWKGLPMDPAACALLPVDWSRIKTLAQRIPDESVPAPTKAAWQELAGAVDGPAAICWYAGSQLHTPLVVAHLRQGAAVAPETLQPLARWLFNGEPGEQDESSPRRWQTQVQASWGPHGKDDEASYRPTIAQQEAWLSFSPDDELVDKALAAQSRKLPSLADTLAQQGPAQAVVSPSRLAELARRESLAVIPASQEHFRQAAQVHLLPRLAALAKLPAAALVPAAKPDAQGWVHVSLVPLAKP